jgi:hypothetical protein
VAGEDLLGLSEDLLAPAAPEEAEATELEPAELPDWLREVAPGEQAAGPAGPAVAPELAGPLAAQMSDLRFEAITGYAGRVEGVTETVGALKDVAGVIRPEILFDGASLQVGKLVDQVVLTPDQTRRVEVLKATLAREAQGVTVSRKGRMALPIIRWITALVLIAAIAAALVGIYDLPAPVPGTGPQRAHDALVGLPASAVVVAAFEYEPDAAAEMQPLAGALLAHLARRGDVTVYALSTRLTGPAMIRQAFGSVEAPDEWLNLGYLSGGPNGVSALIVGGLPGVASPLQDDYRGAVTGLAATRLADLNPSLILVLAARSEGLRLWVEQAGAPSGVPVLAAMSAGSAPLAYPYQQSGQVIAVLSGINDAVAYETLSSGVGVPSLRSTWNAQALGGAAAALLVIAGGLIYGLAASRQQEQE